MRNLEEFIDRQIFLNSKEAEVINSLILEALEEKIFKPQNMGDMLELYCMQFLMSSKGLEFLKIPVLGSFLIPQFQMVQPDETRATLSSSQLNQMLASGKESEDLKAKSEDFMNQLLSSKDFKNFLDPKKKISSVKVVHTGPSRTQTSSADIVIQIVNNGKEEQYNISLKSGNAQFYTIAASNAAFSNTKKKYKSSEQAISAKHQISGLFKLYPALGISINSIIPNLKNIKKEILTIQKSQSGQEENELISSIIQKVWNEKISEDIQNKLLEKYSNKGVEKLDEFIQIIFNLIGRTDKNVIILADVTAEKYSIINLNMVRLFMSHIKNLNFDSRTTYVNRNKKTNDLETKNYFLKPIFCSIGDMDKFLFSIKNIQDKEKNKRYEKFLSQEIIEQFSKNEEVIKEKLNEFIKAVAGDKNLLKKINSELSTNLGTEFSTNPDVLLEGIKKNFDAKIDRISQIKELFSINLETGKDRREIIFKKQLGFIRLSETFESLANIENMSNDSNFKPLIESINLLLNNSLEINKLLPKEEPEQKQDLTSSLTESLILEALDEKEHQKVMSKVMSSGAKGLISAIPSNKTNNSIAVRFDSEDTIDAGIKKVKSSLRSAGYQLDDKRVLKFDQNRDTTDVIKNGQVVGRLFYRVDVKERKGLAYEHILGAVLTGKITDQLKNRIDLGPDASKEDVMAKLNSEEFKPLFDSAKKAAPIIKQKVGKVAKAESVGSTNNKADFVLTTTLGETVGLSAKYAAGEKDNEYKMNKVLGFGTEEDSLVYNPKMIPWWVVGRKTFLEKLKKNLGSFGGREYDPDYENLDAPAWMKTAKESHPDIYKETMEEVYGQIRNVLTKNLRRMKFKDLVSFVMEADLGKEEERGNYDKFIKVVDGPSGLSVTELDMEGGDVDGLDPRKLNPEQIVVQDRSDIIIKLPGFDELKINSVKFKSDMLSSKAGDLKIKTR